MILGSRFLVSLVLGYRTSNIQVLLFVLFGLNIAVWTTLSRMDSLMEGNGCL